MDIKIDFDPADIAKKLYEAIAVDTFKAMFEKAVKEEIERLQSQASWNSNKVIQNTIQNYIGNVIQQMLEKEYKPQIEERIRALMTPEKLESLTSELMQRIVVKDRY